MRLLLPNKDDNKTSLRGTVYPALFSEKQSIKHLQAVHMRQKKQGQHFSMRP